MMNAPDTARGKRLDADQLRREAQRMLDRARELDRLADSQDLDERIAEDIVERRRRYEDPYEEPIGFDEQYDLQADDGMMRT